MLKIGVLCEYNPFHRGHRRLLDALRARFGEEALLLSLMSGSYVQRGDFAILPKYDRARCALINGCDLVLEFPYPYSGACGEVFASAGVALLTALGVDVIAFGSESGDAAALSEAADRLCEPGFEASLAEERKKQPEAPFASLREALYEAHYGQTLPAQANDRLGLEYLKAIRRQKSPLCPMILPRLGGESAKDARAACLAGDHKALGQLVTGDSFALLTTKAPVTMKTMEKAILAAFRLAAGGNTSPFNIGKDGRLFGIGGETRGGGAIADAPAGLVGRLVKAAGKAQTLEELLTMAATKKYTNARIRRAILSCLLGVTKERLASPPAFTRLLGANARGKRALGELPFPVVTRGGQKKSADGAPFSPAVLDAIAFADRADNFYALADSNAPIHAPILL